MNAVLLLKICTCLLLALTVPATGQQDPWEENIWRANNPAPASGPENRASQGGSSNGMPNGIGGTPGSNHPTGPAGPPPPPSPPGQPQQSCFPCIINCIMPKGGHTVGEYNGRPQQGGGNQGPFGGLGNIGNSLGAISAKFTKILTGVKCIIGCVTNCSFP